MRKAILLVCFLCIVLVSLANTASPQPEIQTEAEAKDSLYLARLYQEAGDYKQAQDLAEKVLKSKFKDTPEIRTDAESLLKKILTAKAEDGRKKFRALLDAGESLFKAGNYDGAEKKANEVLSGPQPDATMNQEAKNLLEKALGKKNAEVKKKVRDSLVTARYAIDAGKYDDAINKTNEVLSEPSINEDTRKEAQSLLEEALKKKAEFTKSQQEFQLNVAKRLTEQREFDKAFDKLKEIIPSIQNKEVLAEAKEELEKTQPSLKNKAWGELTAVFMTLKWPLYVFLIFLLIKLVSYIYKKIFRLSNRLQFLELNDDTGLGVKELFVAALNHWKVQKGADTGSLLRLERPRTAFLLGSLPQEKLSLALEKLPTVGTIPMSDWGKVITSVGKWFALCPPWVSAIFSKDTAGKQITAQVTLERETGKVTLLSIWSERAESESGKSDPESVESPPETKKTQTENNKKRSTDKSAQGQAGDKSLAPSEPSQESQDTALSKAVKRGANSLAFKVLYLLALEDASVEQAEAFDQLRYGMILLNRHLSGGKFEDLKESQHNFEAVRKKYPHMLSAYLYEGFALDLLQEHDQAARNFRFVKQQAQEEGNEDLLQRAAYNEAIAHLHNYTYEYTYEEINKSLKLLEELIGQDDPGKSPLKAMAYCAKVRAFAYLPLFWRKVPPELPETSDNHEIRKFKEQRKGELIKWQQEIQAITKTLEEMLQEINQELQEVSGIPPIGSFSEWCKVVCQRLKWALFKKTKPEEKRRFPMWNRPDCRRLQWAIHNAKGHFYLNCAIDFLDEPKLNSFDGFEQQKFLNEAEIEFQQCELLLPSGVETMTAIGTLFLYLKDYEKARKYLEDAIKLNERYEKAFYRLAQTYEEEKNIVKVFETLKEFEKSKRPFHLDKFKKMYEKYKDCLTLEPEPGKKLMLWYPLGEPSGPPVIGRNLGSKQNYRLT